MALTGPWRGAAAGLALAFALAVGSCGRSPASLPEEEEEAQAEERDTTSTSIGFDDDDRPRPTAVRPVAPPAPPLSRSPSCRSPAKPGGGTGSAPPFTTIVRGGTTTPSVPAPPTYDDPLRNVHHPSRLQVITPCVTVTGTARSVRTQSDGNIRFDLEPDPAYVGLLNEVNRRENLGWLVAEIVPADQPGCVKGRPPRPPVGTFNFGICTSANVQAPSPGSHVAVTGPYVLDLRRGWMEIHPAWAVNQVAIGVLPPGAPPTPPTTTFLPPGFTLPPAPPPPGPPTTTYTPYTVG